MAPPVTRRAHEMRRLSGAGLGIDTDSEVRVYDILDADADSNGPGSTWGRTQAGTPRAHLQRLSQGSSTTFWNGLRATASGGAALAQPGVCARCKTLCRPLKAHLFAMRRSLPPCDVRLDHVAAVCRVAVSCRAPLIF